MSMIVPCIFCITSFSKRFDPCRFIKKRYFTSSFLLKNKKFTMNQLKHLYVRHIKDSDTFQAVFYLNYEPLNVEREFNFNRKISEPLDDFIKRMKANLEKTLSAKTKKMNKNKIESQVELPPLDVLITVDNKPFATSRTCKELFYGNAIESIQFSILGRNYSVVLNSPWVDVLMLPSNIMAEFPVYPSKYEAVFVSDSHTYFMWYASVNGKWTEVGTGFIYIPSTKEETKYLKVVCSPGNGLTFGPDKECISSCAVSAGPVNCPFEERHSSTNCILDSSSVRVVSYNILAEVYAETDVAKTELFPYCPSRALALDYRKHLYLKEILGYNSDIICLQEVDEKVFNYDLNHVLRTQGFLGVFCDKGGTIREGVATFYRSSKFRLLTTERIVLAEEVQNRPVFKPLWNALSPNEAAAKALIERPTALQVSVLERNSDTRDKLIVANTHLYFHPDADNIRLLQTGFCMEYIKQLINELNQKNPGDRHSLVFCGDFNSVPDCGIYLLMTEKHVPKDFKDWVSNKDEIVKGVELNQPFSIKSAYGTPKFTNYTHGFKDCLDYIYYQTDYLKLQQVAPLPSEDILQRHVALPSIVFPSDHVALVADFTWT